MEHGAKLASLPNAMKFKDLKEVRDRLERLALAWRRYAVAELEFSPDAQREVRLCAKQLENLAKQIDTGEDPMEAIAPLMLASRHNAKVSDATLGRRILRARKAIGISRRAAAKLLGVPYATVRSWEDGVSVPRAETAELVHERVREMELRATRTSP